MAENPIKIFTQTPEDTEKLGRSIGAQLKAGDVLALYGDLGAGKTTLVRGLAEALGVEQVVTSPTYTIVNEYDGSMPLFHFDMYRLQGEGDLFDIGWEDYVQRGGVIAVEWSERVDEAIDDGAIKITFKIGGGGRSITVQMPEGRSLNI